jgi:hypothetical protein
MPFLSKPLVDMLKILSPSFETSNPLQGYLSRRLSYRHSAQRVWSCSSRYHPSLYSRSNSSRIGGIEPRPAPTVAPQRVLRMAVLAFSHHDKPALQRLGMADRACRHRFGNRPKHLFHQHGAIREMPLLAIRGNRAGRRVDDVGLLRTLTLVSRHRPVA